MHFTWTFKPMVHGTIKHLKCMMYSKTYLKPSEKKTKKMAYMTQFIRKQLFVPYSVCGTGCPDTRQDNRGVIHAPIDPILSMTSDSWNSSPPLLLLLPVSYSDCPPHPTNFSFCWVWKTNRTKAFVSQCWERGGEILGSLPKLDIWRLTIPCFV